MRFPSERPHVCLAALCCLFLALAVAGAHINMPWCDEAWFASPAYNLATRGHMGTTVLDPTASWADRNLSGIGRYTYWIVPLYPVAQAAWQAAAGPSLTSVRCFSVFWGLVALLASFFLVGRLAADSRAGLLAVALLSIDFQFLWSASVARMDMMCAALGACGLAAYALLRERDLRLAVVASHAFVAASGLTHFLGMAPFASLVALTLYLDRRRLRPRHVALAAFPYLLGGLAWGVYILKDPALFAAQFGGNAGGRFLLGPGFIRHLWEQFLGRVFVTYGISPQVGALSHLKAYILLVYAAGTGVALLVPAIRKEPGRRALLLVWLAGSLAIALSVREVAPFYFVHFLIPVAAVTSLAAVWAWDRQGRARWMAAGTAAALVLVQSAVFVSRARQNPYRNYYLAAANYIRGAAPPGGLVMASGELAFELGFDSNFIDDYRLGCITRRRPSVIVLDRHRYDGWLPYLEDNEPACFRYIHDMLDRDFRLRYQNPAYRVFVRAAPE